MPCKYTLKKKNVEIKSRKYTISPVPDADVKETCFFNAVLKFIINIFLCHEQILLKLRGCLRSEMKFRFVMKKIPLPLVFMIKSILIHEHQQKLTRVNTNQYESDTNQQELDVNQHKSKANLDHEKQNKYG